MEDSTRVDSRPRVLLLIPHLGGGGAEAVVAQLARGLSQSKYELHLGLLTTFEADDISLPAGICVHRLGGRRVAASTGALLRLIWQLRPRLILSGMAHLNFMVLLLRPLFPHGTRVLVRQNTTVSLALSGGFIPPSTRWKYLLYKYADRVLCQSVAMADDLRQIVGLKVEKISVVPNPIDVNGLRARAAAAAIATTRIAAATRTVSDRTASERTASARVEGDTSTGNNSPIRLLAMGRLAPEKGFDLLLRSLLIAEEQGVGAVRLTIAGSGAEEVPLRKLCRDLKLQSVVDFAGPVKEPFVEFALADLFVLSSRLEGMPNALLEAAAYGLPIVATPCSGGVVDLLRGQPGVWLAEDVSAGSLASALRSALGVIWSGERFAHDFVDRFAFERAIGAYEAVFDEELKW